MRIITQTISQGTIEIQGAIVAASGLGLALFVGFTHGDNPRIIEKMAQKIATLRVFPDQDGKTNRSLADVGGALLVIPNFTLYGSLKKARRPSFTEALNPDDAMPFFNHFVILLKQQGLNVNAGIFGADMRINLTNEGPFTLILDSRELYPNFV